MSTIGVAVILMNVTGRNWARHVLSPMYSILDESGNVTLTILSVSFKYSFAGNAPSLKGIVTFRVALKFTRWARMSIPADFLGVLKFDFNELFRRKLLCNCSSSCPLLGSYFKADEAGRPEAG